MVAKTIIGANADRNGERMAVLPKALKTPKALQ